MYVEVLKETRWPNPFQSSATAKPSMQGNTGLKMTGPYDYVPPSYWLTDTERGGAFGFITETAPCPTIPSVESLRKFIPQDHLWPIDEYWDFHAGGNVFKDIKLFTKAINARYGKASSLDDYVMKAQLMAYEGERAMFEAYGRNKYRSTGVLHEMLNNAWPSLIWNLYDYYLCPVGAYFGTKKACEPLHIQYSYDDQSIYVVNSRFREFKGLKAKAQLLDMNLKERFSKESTLDVSPDCSQQVLDIPDLPDLTPTYFVRLQLADATGKTISTNFYCLSTRPDVLDWDKSAWYYTPTKSHADFTGLQTLPKVKVKVASATVRKGKENLTKVTVSNPTNHLAFFVHLRITKGAGGTEVLPVLWEDNYFELMPGEERVIEAIYSLKDLGGAAPVVEVEGWNIR
jgi:exo-1,4-beta-D-glucosaminidase